MVNDVNPGLIAVASVSLQPHGNGKGKYNPHRQEVTELPCVLIAHARHKKISFLGGLDTNIFSTHSMYHDTQCTFSL